ncbi:MAG: proline--tRNA ligase [Alphaproteobacteria bacterium]|jgi:prolyl-tRNA synthetase|nr:proline--tRNA ligase [Alphaproteobacteria bacterium]
MRLSHYFLPTLKETPAEAQIASHRLMLRAGMVNQTTSGIYSWLPLGLRVMEKIEKIICEEQDRIGCHKVLMSTIQPADLWRKSGRYEDYGKEMLRFQDRHEREMLYGPTNEEVITDVMRQYVKSYRQVPQVLYQIQWKFRDEVRPRFGVMRGREFLMKDGYSFDLDFDSAKKTYERIFGSYLRTFARMGLTAIPVKADSGAIGGDMSHEFQIVAPTGESAIYYDAAFDSLTLEQMTLENVSGLYAAADEKHDPATCPVPAERIRSARGIEIGHIFYFGTKYSEPLGAKVVGPDGKMVALEMGSYGIGVSRLVAAIIEANHDDQGIQWPEAVAPFKVGLLNLKAGDKRVETLAESVYHALCEKGIEVLYDDRDERAGAKFADMDLIGLPWQLAVGARTVDAGTVEMKNRRTGAREELPLEAALERVKRG